MSNGFTGKDCSEDRLFDGQLRLLQAKSGHRAGTDAVLLAASLPVEAGRIADLGAASGVVGLRAAQMNAAAQVTLIEREAAQAALARGNIALNRLNDRVTVCEADLVELARRADFREAFDCLLTNPPFLDAKRSRVSEDVARARAHVIEGDLDDWVRAASSLVAPHGSLIMIHRADALADVLGAMEKRFGALALRFVHATEGEKASRLIIAGIKGSRGPVSVLAPLILHRDGGFTPEAARIHAGEGRICMKAGGRTRPVASRDGSADQ